MRIMVRSLNGEPFHAQEVPRPPSLPCLPGPGAVLMLLSAAVGAPWMVATTVPSLAHVRSLATTAPEGSSSPQAEAPNGAPGAEGAPAQRGVRENRVTGLAIHVSCAQQLLYCTVLCCQYTLIVVPCSTEGT